jgi:hypothetical protein
MDADLGSDLPRYDYVSPGLNIVRPDAAFPEMIVGDTQGQHWRWHRYMNCWQNSPRKYPP